MLVAVLGFFPTDRDAVLWLGFALLYGVVALVFWCYLVFAKWLTSEDDAENDEFDEDDEEATGR